MARNRLVASLGFLMAVSIAACGDDTAAGAGGAGGNEAGGGREADGGADTVGGSPATGGGGAGGGGGADGGGGVSEGGGGADGGGGGGAEAECGNEVIEVGEQCDGTEVGDATCESLGYFTGTLACDACAFDVGACTDCGNDAIDAGETCDGTDLGGDSCEDLGYDTGDLACTSDCALDESGCAFFSCNNGILEPNEDCDGTLLGGATCTSVGAFDNGTLDCAANCTFDTSACTTCGDDVAALPEACDGIDLAGQTCQTLGFVSGELVCDSTCGFDASGCSNLPVPGTDDLVITEIMQNPAALADSAGEWFEVWNPANTTFQLGGCVVEGGAAGESFTIAGDVQIAPLGRLTFAIGASPGFVPDYVYSGFNLANTGDTVRIVCDSAIVDEVVYASASFPIGNGSSMSLTPGLGADDNDVGSNWCLSFTAFGSGDDGTPGLANDPCAAGYTIGFCRLQFPTVIDVVEGTNVTVFGRVFVAGLTDLTTGNDTDPLVVAAVGHGPDGTDPALGGWTWTTAAPNPAWDGTAFGEPNNDEYQATLTVPPASGSPYDFAYRFSGDGGLTWTHCDGDIAGSSNGYAVANAGQMISQPPAGDPTALLWCFQDAAGVFTLAPTTGTGTLAYGAGVASPNSVGGATNVAGCSGTTRAATGAGWNSATFATASTAGDCYELVVDTHDGPLSLYFDDQRSSTGPISWGIEVRPDAAGVFTPVVIDQTTHTPFGPHPMNTVSLPATLENQPLAEIRICAYGGAATGTWRIDNLRIESP